MTSMYNGFYSKNTFIWTSPITPPNPCRTPIASSTILAVVLLKLGGYGIVWLTLILKPLTEHIECPFLMLPLWGIVMASSICLREANLKSLIAYSSVSHIALVITAVLFQTPWSFTVLSCKTDNCLWTYFILTILPSKLELRVSPQPNYITYPRFSNSASTNSVLMTSSKSHWPCPTRYH